MIIDIRVHLKSKGSKIIEDNGLFDVYVNQAPVKGKANKEIIKILAKYFNLKTNQIFLVSGEKSKTKKFEIKSDD